MPRDPRAYLFDVLQAAERVERFIRHKSFEDYVADDLLRAGVERQFEIIGEALNQLQKHDSTLLVDIREHRKIIGFRNLLVHGYAEIDDAVVWSVAIEKLPWLREDAEALLNKLNTD